VLRSLSDVLRSLSDVLRSLSDVLRYNVSAYIVLVLILMDRLSV